MQLKTSFTERIVALGETMRIEIHRDRENEIVIERRLERDLLGRIQQNRESKHTFVGGGAREKARSFLRDMKYLNQFGIK